MDQSVWVNALIFVRTVGLRNATTRGPTVRTKMRAFTHTLWSINEREHGGRSTRFHAKCGALNNSPESKIPILQPPTRATRLKQFFDKRMLGSIQGGTKNSNQKFNLTGDFTLGS